MNIEIHQFSAAEAAARIRVPSKTDNKYSHGVLGVVTGSKKYPGAAVLGVEAAHRTGIGMVRFLGSHEAAKLVLSRRPEVVTVPGTVNAWLIGSGLDECGIEERREVITEVAGSGVPVVLDAGALPFVSQVSGPVVLTPHAGELERLVPRLSGVPAEDEKHWAARAAKQLDCVVLLKGNVSYVSWPQPDSDATKVIAVDAPTSWLATAGTGDVLAGIIGALVAVAAATGGELGLSELAEITATGAFIHGQAAGAVAERGPFPALDVADAVSEQVLVLLKERR